MVYLIIAIVVIGILAVIGSLLWKRANRLDPASESEPTRFFIQNQLAAILAIVGAAFIVLIFLNKDMDTQQKGIALAVRHCGHVDRDFYGRFDGPDCPSKINDQETAVVVGLTGKDLVFWTKAETPDHLCQTVSDLQLQSKDNTIYSGSVADAHAAGRSVLPWRSRVRSSSAACPHPRRRFLLPRRPALSHALTAPETFEALETFEVSRKHLEGLADESITMRAGEHIPVGATLGPSPGGRPTQRVGWVTQDNGDSNGLGKTEGTKFLGAG